MTQISQDQLDALEAAHRRIAHVLGKDDAWEIVLRRPRRDEYKAFRSRVHNASQIADAQELLCRQVVVAVGALIALDKASTLAVQNAFGDLLEEYPGIPEACGKTLEALVGAAGDEAVKRS